MIHNVFGNGESRKDLDVDSIDGVKYGCNAIYRDHHMDYLFNKDKGIQHEILTSECWRNTTVIIQTQWYGQSIYREAYRNMHTWQNMLGTNDYTDCGSAALTFASHKAKSYGGDVYMYGFDFDDPETREINNIYKNTPNYSMRLNQRKGVTKEFLNVFEKYPEINYVHVNREYPQQLTKYKNVRWQALL
tara:strand:+ start:679 stop:1245 length:567 start_codon:yes stop_codon:yes gene_type:complete